MNGDLAWVRDLIREVPDFPRPGVSFKDLTPLFANPKGFCETVDALADPFRRAGVDKVVGIEARGFILAAPVAATLGAGFVPVRKAGKLPWLTHSESYSLEYGTDRLEMHTDGLTEAERVLVVDDVLATGGTAAATMRLAERVKAEVVGFACVVELAFLGGRGKLEGHEIVSLISYD